ncbi:glycosyltransferase family 4 protein [Selenomonas ruminantium]|uniref:Glycosyltransferase involved in cell wall bisynthesis n=1 Tax=Selenomonas ruminantium TaxID=971 RepID=A0A1K1NNP8_SELRU|nr:glycosyltransferase family 4 protein [Selenomonas ruminantium]SFW36905.1 Glycosyltransferase involved in cell wall bisynthesis [Selenomonas ruminantium]
MLLTMYFDSNRNVMGDLYKNIVNSFSKKEKIIVVVPNAYDENEFDDSFLLKLKEDISNIENKFLRIYKLYEFIKEISTLIKKYNVTKCYFQVDQFIYDYGVLLANPKLEPTVWIHDVVVHDGEGWMAKIYKLMTKYLLLPRLRHIIVSYNNAKKELGVKYGADFERITDVIYLPRLAELEFEDIKNTRYDIEYDFIFYGRIEKYKGLDLLLEAMDNPFMKDVTLLIVGRGREDYNIKQRVDAMQNVKFINEYVSNRDLAKYIAKSRCVILPYRSATGTQTIQLANFYGKFVLATKVGCFTEYIKEGVNGFYIKNFSKESVIEAMLLMHKNYSESDYKMEISLKRFALDGIAEKIQITLSGGN